MDLCSNGIYWIVKFEVFADLKGRVAFPQGTLTDQWVQHAGSLRIKAMWVQGRAHHEMLNSLFVAMCWDPAAEANLWLRRWADRRGIDQAQDGQEPEQEQELEQRQEQEQEQEQAEENANSYLMQQGQSLFCSLCSKRATAAHLVSEKHRNKLKWLKDPLTAKDYEIMQDLEEEGLVQKEPSEQDSQWETYSCHLCSRSNESAGMGHFTGKEHQTNTSNWEDKQGRKLRSSPPPAPDFASWAHVQAADCSTTEDAHRKETMEIDDGPACQASIGDQGNHVEKEPKGVAQTQEPAILEDEASQKENEQRGMEKNQDREAIKKIINELRDQAEEPQGTDQKKETVNEQEALVEDPEKQRAPKVEKGREKEDQEPRDRPRDPWIREWQGELEPDDGIVSESDQLWTCYADMKEPKFHGSRV